MSHRKHRALGLAAAWSASLGVALTLVVGSPAVASEAHLGANTVATGGASTALPKDNSAITGSPGAMALVERYDGMGFGSIGPASALRYGLSAMDSRTGSVAFGIAYRRGQVNLPITDADLPGWIEPGTEPTNKEFTHDLTVALGAPIADRKLSVGVNGTFLWWKRERRGQGFSGNADLGIAAAPHELFSAALTGRNLLFMLDDEDMPLAGVLGLRVGSVDTVHGLVDVEVAEGSGLTLRAGVDGSAGPSRMRAGYAWDGVLEQHQVSWGLGIENEAGAFEYAMRVPLTNNDRGVGGLLHTISVRVYPPPLEPEMPR
ncbi:MAG: hypothetical protein EP330_05115 [Deltaproteobacteria bacterium]|nr:MAG: hypothetical protein EP330_05115 [Deltaproteobacteria bacterium]